MTGISIREASVRDLAHILAHRRSMFEAMGERGSARLDAMETASESYFRSALENGTYRGWLAEAGEGEVVGGGGIVISAWPAMPRAPQAQRATILNMYTDPAYRRRGVARRLMTAMIDWLTAQGFCEVSLHASDFGRPLYEQLGFRPTNEMRLTLRDPSRDADGTCCANRADAEERTGVNSHSVKGVTVRLASKADVENIRQCLVAAFEPFRTRYTRGGFFDTVPSAANLMRRLVDMTLFVADAEGRVIGTVACNKRTNEEGHLRGMAVLPEWQGSGVAASLLTTAEAELKRKGCSRVTLDTTEPLQRAIRFYEKHGFRPSGRVSDFFGMPLHEYGKGL
jgi:GNAT superfamily N-acetyltransferase